MYKSAGQALGTLKNPIQTSYVTGYIKSTDIDIKEKTKFCDNVIPKICINPNIGENWHDINTFTDLESLWGNVSQQDPNWNQNNAFLASAKQNSTKNTGQINAKMTQGLRGIFGGDCIEMDQANLYMVKRFLMFLVHIQRSILTEKRELMDGCHSSIAVVRKKRQLFV